MNASILSEKKSTIQPQLEVWWLVCNCYTQRPSFIDRDKHKYKKLKRKLIITCNNITPPAYTRQIAMLTVGCWKQYRVETFTMFKGEFTQTILTEAKFEGDNTCVFRRQLRNYVLTAQPRYPKAFNNISFVDLLLSESEARFNGLCWNQKLWMVSGESEARYNGLCLNQKLWMVSGAVIRN